MLQTTVGNVKVQMMGSKPQPAETSIQSLKFYTTSKLGSKTGWTKEGFLVCYDVPIARIGTLYYGPDETPVPVGRDGIVRVERDESEVFSPATIASFNGKAVTNDHPTEDVLPENYEKYMVGTVQNARRGEGINSDCLVADLVIYDPEAIKAVLDGKREVSCGYDADYETIEPGRGRQFDILGNHVALVEDGRCGSRCSIQDRSMKMAKKTLRQRFMDAISTKDEDEMKKIMDEVSPEEKLDGKGEGLQVHVHNYSPGDKAGETKDDNEMAPKKEAGEKSEDEGMDMGAKLDKILACLEKMAGGTKDEDGDDGDEGEMGEEATEDSGEEVKEEKQVAKTQDAAKIKSAYQDVAARSEILCPGFKMPMTLDAVRSADPKVNALCNIKRKALDSAYKAADEEKKELLNPLLSGVDFRKAPCATIDAAFIGASQLIKQKNNAAGASGGQRTNDKKSGAPTPAELNKKNEEFWNSRKAI